MTDGRLAFAAAVRVVVGVHNRAADGGTDAEVARLTRLTYSYNLVLDVADLTDGRLALDGNESHFARRHLQGRVGALFCHYLSGNAGGSRYLRAAAGLKLDCVHDGTYGDVR